MLPLMTATLDHPIKQQLQNLSRNQVSTVQAYLAHADDYDGLLLLARMTAQQLFAEVQQVYAKQMLSTLGLLVDNTADTNRAIMLGRPLVQQLCDDGLITFHAGFKDKSTGELIGAHYTMHAPDYSQMVQAVEAGTATCENERSDNLHSQAAHVLAQYVFKVDRANFTAARDMLEQGYANIKGVWYTVEQYSDATVWQEVYDTQAATLRVAYQTGKRYPNGFSFHTFTDYRGRMYYRSGLLNPQGDQFTRSLLRIDGTTQYDSTASFAQFTAMLTGNVRMATACNLYNYSSAAKDFYTEAAAAVGVTIRAGLTREVAKRFYMRKAYGSGFDGIAAACEELASTPAELDAVRCTLAGLKRDNSMDILGGATVSYATTLAEQGRQAAWTTPSGKTVAQRYWEQQSVELQLARYAPVELAYPTKLEFKVATDKVALGQGRGENAARAMAANLVQSLDATFCAMLVLYMHKVHGVIMRTTHDAFRFPVGYEDKFMTAAWQVYRAMNSSSELQTLRNMLGLDNTGLVLQEATPQFMAHEPDEPLTVCK